MREYPLRQVGTVDDLVKRDSAPADATVYVYDGPDPGANLLGVFKSGQAIAVNIPRIWIEYVVEAPQP